MMVERERCCSAGSETARRAILNTVSRLQIMTPSLQNFGSLNETCGCIVSFFRSDAHKVGNSFTWIF